MTEVWEQRQPAVTAGFPWPPAEDAPILAAFGETWKSASFDPRSFFRLIPRQGGTGAAFLYYVVVGMLVRGASLFWSTVGLGAPGQDRVAELGVEVAPLTSFLLTPLILVVGLGVSAGITHVMLLVVRGATEGIGTTMRVLCYAYSPMILGVIPVLGGLVGVIWMLVVAVIGLGAAHQVPTWKPALAVILPFLILMGLMVFALMAVLATGAAILG
jgi:hypothetical protein